MKYCILFLFMSYSFLCAQETKIALSLKLETTNKRNVMTINKEVNPGEPIEGYFVKYFWKDKKSQTEWTEGKIQDGGYSILKESSFFKTMLNVQDRDVKAKTTEISGMMPAVHLSLFRSVFSFYLTPFYYKELDSIALKTGYHRQVPAIKNLIPSANVFMQYIIYKMPDTELSKSGDNILGRRTFDEEFNLTTRYSGNNFLTAFGEDLYLNYISDSIEKNSTLTLKLIKYEDGKRLLPIEIDDTLKESLLSSLRKATVKNAEIDFNVEFLRKLNSNTVNPSSDATQYFASDANIRYANELNDNAGNHWTINDNKQLNSRENISMQVEGLRVYYSQFEIPFVMYNEKKNQLYDNYKTKGKILKGKYNVFIVPISSSEKGLLVDLFIQYAKICVEDGILRWTPIKKQLLIPSNWNMAAVELPKENWSAVFSRENEKYEIYGYSDYERYITETLYIKVNNNSKER